MNYYVVIFLCLGIVYAVCIFFAILFHFLTMQLIILPFICIMILVLIGLVIDQLNDK